ncbi:shikimate dehydrogenase [Desulfosoma caldarium]|uniref:Shikimate dehydrogenase (NADP(+)) n=1 Tax=Desulfosoma caldarium TaxID=610254 RepID=A0A3N1UUF3_9BACT|nr:shikimate dehydrogenase [Desulfosoma caldarium]ROQ93348.1 shikimate dehydrogenase [Desulfosoma caldarium]
MEVTQAAVRSVQHDLFGVLGRPAGHSLSPAMMQAAFDVLGLKAYYLALEADDLAEALAALDAVGFRGLSVTVPFKQEAMKLCVHVDAAAQRIGAVNTLRRTQGGWEGRNTDWLGAVRALERQLSLQGVTALVFGAGGAARGVVYGLTEAGAHVVITNRTEDRARELAAALPCSWVPMESFHRVKPQVVVQTTSAGMSGRPYAFRVPQNFFTPQMVVMDIVYSPLETPFLRQAKAAGARVVDGLEMLLYQGIEQFSWWLNRPAPEAAMRQALRRAAHERKGKAVHE